MKEGLQYCQTACLPLHSALLLIELARLHLMCDDEEQAEVQLKGVQGILDNVLRCDEGRGIYCAF